MSAASYTGIPLALLATTAYNMGLVLEKRALGQMPALDIRRVPQVVVSLLTSRAWLTGFALMLTGLALSGILVSHQTAVGIAIGVVSSPYLYVLAGCLAVAMLLFQAALQACPASIVVPVSGVTGSVYFIIAGTWLFHEHLPASPGRLALRLTGIALAALVLVVLSRRAPEQAPARAAGGTEMAPGYPAEVRRR